MRDLLLVMLAGGVGATMRLLVDEAFARANARFPVGILVVNVLGSALLGAVVGWGAAGVLAQRWQLVLGVGVCGGFTTFSTAAVDAARMARAGRRVAVAVQWLGGFGICLLAAWLGHEAARG